MLACTNVGPNQNKFYRMQVLGARASHTTPHACWCAHSNRHNEQRMSDILDQRLSAHMPVHRQHQKDVILGYLEGVCAAEA